MTLAGVLWGGSTRRQGYPIAIATWDGGCVLIDPAGQRVARQLPAEHAGREQLALRDRWAKHVPTPSYYLEPGGVWIVEEYVAGEHLSVAPDHLQIELVRGFLRSYRRLVEDEAPEHRTGPAHHLASREVLLALPIEIRHRLEGLPLLREVDRWPWVATTSDHSLKNVILAPGKLVFIDVMPFVFRPFFDLPVALLTLWGASLPAVRRAHLGGDLETELRDIFAAADFPYEATPRTRQGLAALSIAVRALAVSPAGGSLDGDAVRRHANELLRSQRLLTPEDWQGDPKA